MRKPVLLAAALTLTLAACHKSDSSPGIDFGPGNGFSYRDPANRSTATQDPTDWTTDATWNDQEKALFSELSIGLDGPQQPSLIDFTAGYPNPAPSATWTMRSRKTSGAGATSFTVAAVLVRRNYQVVLRLPHSRDTNGEFSAYFDYAKLGLSPGELYRLYYVVFANNGLVYKGHGDLRYDQ